MDAGYILVAVLTSAAVAWLVWVEIHSRRNAALQTARKLPEAPESTANGDRTTLETHELGGKTRLRPAQPRRWRTYQ